ncbi:hypothetical protein [Corynebacterium rhinophilum]|uniref:hypothetical protein n=1 Tax=Corynebacterium rhinophilum TaxID=3050197 RepID=UPI00254E3271|nr:hypothetical protein [Corynebacterium sp. MSK189]MDK8673317.1 hypothetical protein [Corynebacterium sp. MSK189]
MGQLNPTRQEIINAHEELEKLFNRLPATRAAKETILKVLPPLPRLTMAEIEWDDDKHYLAEAEHCSLGKVVMLSKICGGEEIYYIRQGFKGELLTFASPDKLTPTGRRYVLQEGEE